MRLDKQSGSVVLYALIVMITMVTISMTMVNIFVPKLHVARDATQSVVAIYAADSAVEACLYDARHPALSQISRTTGGWLSIGATFDITELSPSAGVDISTDCRTLGQGATPGIFQFRTVGTFGNAQRSFEVSTE